MFRRFGKMVCVTTAWFVCGVACAAQQERFEPLPTLAAPAALQEADGQTPDVRAPAADTQSSAPPGPQRRGRSRGWGRSDNPNLKNHTSIKAAYRLATAEAAKATVHVLADDKDVALGTIVDPQGYVVTKASLLEGKIACRIPGREPLAAQVVGASTEHDLALLKIDANDLTAVTWRSEPAVPGTLVAAVAPAGEAIGLGVISSEPRAVGDPFDRRIPRRAWLGVVLGGGEHGVGLTEVVDGQAAAEAGLQAGDAIQSIDGEAMRTMEQVRKTVGSHAPGDKLTLVIQRQDEQLTKEVVLGKPPRISPTAAPEDQWGGGPFSDRRDGFPRVLPHDTAVLPNQCGGPLIDMDGHAVGINIARALRVATYATPADVVQQFVRSAKP